MAKVFDWDGRLGSYIDSSIKIQGTASSAMSFVNAEKGLAGFFPGDGTANVITWSGTGLDFLGDLTIEIWLKPTRNTDPFGRVVQVSSATNSLDIYYNRDGDNQRLGVGRNGTIKFTATGNIPYDKWSHVILVSASDGDTDVYVNGIKELNPLVLGTPVASTGTVNIGYGSGREFGGWISKFTAYDSLLSLQEINNMYSSFERSTNLTETKRNFYYPKPTDLSKEVGLVAAYNMIPQNGVLSDVSVNNNSAIINGCLTILKGLNFNGLNDNCVVQHDTSFDFSTGDFSFLWRVRHDADGGCILNKRDVAGGIGWRFFNVGATSYRFDFDDNANNNPTELTFSGLSFGYGIWNDFALTVNGIYVTLYINGNFVDRLQLNPRAAFDNTRNLYIGSFETTSNYFSGGMEDIRVFNRAISEAEIKEYHNYYSTQISYRNSFKYEGVGSFPFEFMPGTGSFEIGEFTTTDPVLNIQAGDKYLECTSPGTCSFQSNQAYGTWEFDVYKENTVNNLQIEFISDRPDIYPNIEGYVFRLGSTESVSLTRLSLGTFSDKFVSAIGYINNNTWYRIKITRKSDGEFTVFIKGDSFGKEYQLVDVTGGSGTNPVTDNTYTVSKYSVLDFDLGDRMSHIAYSQDINKMLEPINVNEFITEWNITAGSFTFPAGDTGVYNAEIDFGDGSGYVPVTTYNDANLTHVYSSSGTYQIKVKGIFPWVYINNDASVRTLITKVIQWGNIGTTKWESSFYGCNNLTTIPSIPYVGTTIDQELFFNCSSLSITNLTIPTGIITVQFYAFRGCSNITGTLTLPSSTTNLNAGAFQDSGISGTLNLNNAVTLANSTFNGCTGLTGTLDVSSVTTFGLSTFAGCTGFTGLTMSTSVTSYSSFGLFSGCSGMTGTLTIPTSVTALENAMFRGTGFTALSLGSSLQSIGNDCFENCSSATGTLTLPATVASIGTQAFNNTSFTRVDSYPSAAPTASADSFDLGASIPLHIPVSNSGYGVSPWTDTPPFSSITNDL